jgi:Flp pilus assembly protein TadB
VVTLSVPTKQFFVLAFIIFLFVVLPFVIVSLLFELPVFWFILVTVALVVLWIARISKHLREKKTGED